MATPKKHLTSRSPSGDLPPEIPEPGESLLAGADETADASRYVVLPTPRGWQLLIELGTHYLLWDLRGEPGSEGQAVPGINVASESLEAEDGSLRKPALERDGNEIGTFRNVRTRAGKLVPLGDCLADGVFELVFDGPLLHGRWRLSRSGNSRRQAETWTLHRATTGA